MVRHDLGKHRPSGLDTGPISVVKPARLDNLALGRLFERLLHTAKEPPSQQRVEARALRRRGLLEEGVEGVARGRKLGVGLSRLLQVDTHHTTRRGEQDIVCPVVPAVEQEDCVPGERWMV